MDKKKLLISGLTLNDGIARRDQLLEIVSDARLVAPLVKMAELHSKVNPKSYLYWFTHKTQFGDYAEVSSFYKTWVREKKEKTTFN